MGEAVVAREHHKYHERVMEMFGQLMSDDTSCRVGTVQTVASTKLPPYLLTYQTMHTAGDRCVNLPSV
jgi:hypothetical protein